MQHAADAEANIIVGQVINPEIGDDLIVTVIATGFEREEQPAARPVDSRTPGGADSQRTSCATGVDRRARTQDRIDLIKI